MASPEPRWVPLFPDRTTHTYRTSAVLYNLENPRCNTSVGLYTYFACGAFTFSGPNEPEPLCQGVTTCFWCAARRNRYA